MKKYNPYKVQTSIINRFRGLSDEDGRHNIAPSFVGNIVNLTSTKIGEMNQRAGQDISESYSSGILDAGRLSTSKFVVEGGNVYAENTTNTMKLPVISYDSPTEWEYPWDIVTPIEDAITELIPTPTCSDLWSANDSMSAYENADESDTDITDGTEPCWTVTCDDLWDLFPDYSDYQNTTYETTETELSGGNLAISSCWTETLNCKAMYKLYPEWDDYQSGDTFPDCWDFQTDVEDMTCADVFDLQGTPTSLQKTNGVFPDCLQDSTPTVSFVTTDRLLGFSLTPSTLDIEVAEDAEVGDVIGQLVVEAQGSIPKTLSSNYFDVEDPDGNISLSLSDVDVGEGFVAYESRTVFARTVTATYNVILEEEVT